MQASLTWQKLDHTVKQKMILVEQFKRTLSGEAQGSSGSGSGSGGKRASPEDIVRLYDSAVSSLNEMGALDGYREEVGGAQGWGSNAARASASSPRDCAAATTYRCTPSPRVPAPNPRRPR